ncbi:MAG: N-acetylmuramoyl-L-alanine amidase [Patescibacteria group bacterium]|jgi:N-acetyl-anhydromuramyl-L-alanine amidase AmpD
MPDLDVSKVAGGFKIQKYLIPIGGFFVVMLFSVIGFSFFGIMRDNRIPEVTPMTSISGASVTCQDWGAGTKGAVNFQEDITYAANNSKIQPALLGAIFSAEHGGWPVSNWATDDYTTPNQTSGAMGPFQFMPGTWAEQCKKYNNDQVKKLGLAPIADCGPDTAKDFKSASKVSAYYLKYLAGRITKNSKTAEKADIQGIAVSYNGGPGTYDDWKDSGFATLNSESSGYKTKVWDRFQVLYKGCSSNDATNLPTTISSFDTSFMNAEPLKSWLKNRPKINTQSQTATGITLHWTGSWDKNVTAEQAVSKLITGWYNRDTETDGTKSSVFNHLVIDPAGKVWQLIPLDVRQAGSGKGTVNNISANDFTIGIEIAGTGPADVGPDTAAYNAALTTVEKLLSEIPTIKNDRGNDLNFKAKSGIFGHFQTATATSTSTVGCSSAKDDPGLAFMKELWDDLKIWQGLRTNGNGCYFENGKKKYYPPR